MYVYLSSSPKQDLSKLNTCDSNSIISHIWKSQAHLKNIWNGLTLSFEFFGSHLKWYNNFGKA